MATVKIVQVHGAFVRQTDAYEIADDRLAQLADVPEADREEFVWEHGTAVDTTTEIESLGETVSVEVAW